MTQSTALEQGLIGSYPAETPDFHEGEQGKGASIAGKVTAQKGTAFSHNDDKHVKKLKSTFGSAMNAKGKFGNF